MSALTNSQGEFGGPTKTDFEKGMLALLCEPERQSLFSPVFQEDLRTRIIQGVQVNLDRFNQAYNQTKDPRAVFNHAYEKVTQAILWKTMNRSQSFKHRVWLATLDDTFAKYYFDALDAYDKGQPGAEVWGEVFHLIGVKDPKPGLIPKATILEALILPLIVHTIHDLPLAVAEVALEEAQFLIGLDDGLSDYEAIKGAQLPEFTSQALKKVRNHKHGPEFLRRVQAYCPDFYMINSLLRESDEPDRPDREYSVINQVQATVYRYSPFLLGKLDDFFGQHDERLTHSVLEALRGMAWFNAIRLLEAETIEECDHIRAQIVERTRSYINSVYRPASRPARLGLGLARLVSGRFRTWPTDEATSLKTATNS